MGGRGWTSGTAGTPCAKARHGVWAHPRIQRKMCDLSTKDRKSGTGRGCLQPLRAMIFNTVALLTCHSHTI